MRRHVAATFCLATVAAVLMGVACARQSEKPDAKPRQIAFIVPTLSNPFFVDMTASAKESVKSDSAVSLTVQAPAQFTDLERQVALVESSIASHAAVICLVAADSRGVVPVLKRAQDAGIPVVLVDNTVDSVEAARAGLRMPTHVGSDNFLGAQLAGRYIVAQLKGAGEVALLEGVLGSQVATARKEGFLDALKGSPGVRLVASQTANYEREQGLNVFRGILQAHPRLSALFAANDEMALGALEAIKEKKLSRPLVVVGFDATQDALAAIDSGKLSATVQQQPREMGRVAVMFANRLLRGEAVPRDTLVAVRLVTRGH